MNSKPTNKPMKPKETDTWKIMTAGQLRKIGSDPSSLFKQLSRNEIQSRKHVRNGNPRKEQFQPGLKHTMWMGVNRSRNKKIETRNRTTYQLQEKRS